MQKSGARIPSASFVKSEQPPARSTVVTDEPGTNRKGRKAKTYEKMASVSGELELALIVKAAVRLANFRACVAQNNSGLLSMYKNEHPIFKQSVYRPSLCEPLWQEIERIVNA